MYQSVERSLPRRPSKLAPPENVNVQVGNLLTGRVAGIDDHSIAALGYVQLVRNFRGGVKQMTHQR